MRRALTLAILRTLVLVVLTASAALLYDYTRPLAAFCEAGAGCEAVRASSFAYILGVPQPAIGLLAYMVIFGITLLRHELRRKLLFPLSAAGALFGLAFLAIQAFVIQRFCGLCVVVDVAAILLTVFAWIHRGQQGSDGSVPRFAWSLLGAGAVVVPLLLGAARPEPPVPAAIARFWVPGKLTIVELSDFECPFCKILHPALKQAMEPYGDKVQLVRLSIPLRSHPRAQVAARAYACAKKQNRGEDMAHVLFDAKDLSEDACRAAATKVGLDQPTFEKCFDGPEGEEAMMRDVELARAIPFKGLPTTFVGTKTLVGARGSEELREIIDEQLAGEASQMPSIPQGWMWALIGAVFVAVATVHVVRKPKEAETASAQDAEPSKEDASSES